MVLLELIPIGTVLTVLTTQILEIALAAQDVLIERETFRIVSKNLKDIHPLLAELRLRNMQDSQASRQALASLEADIKRAKKLIDDCTTKSRFYLLVNCRAIVKDAQQVIRDIGKSLSLLSVAGAEVSADIQHNIHELSQELLRTQFHTSQSKLRIINKLELGLREHRMDQGFANDLIREIARAVGVPVEASEIRKELASFKREKEEAAARKEREEEAFMEQVIALLSNADTASTPEIIQTSYSKRLICIRNVQFSDEIPPLHSFMCPLTEEVMFDPVTVVATGQTYDRESIEKWFASGQTIDPVTKVRLSNFSLRPNNPLKQSIEEWVQRNYCIHIRKAHEMIQSGDETRQIQALDELCDLCGKDVRNKNEIAEAKLIADIVVLLKTRNKELKRKILTTLCTMVVDNNQNKDQLVAAGGVDQVVRCLARDVIVSKLAVKLLQELLHNGPLENNLVYEQLVHEKSAILLLVTLLNGQDTEAAYDARLILDQLCDKDYNIVQMANASWYNPLVNRLKEGTDDSRLIMAKTIAKMSLTEQNKQTLGEIGAIPALIKMLPGSLEAKEAAFGALQNLVSFRDNKRKMAEECAIPIVLEHLYSARYPIIIRESAAAIVEQFTTNDGVQFFLDAIDIKSTLLRLLAVHDISTSSNLIHKHVLRSLFGMLSIPNAEQAKEAKSVMISANCLPMLLSLFEGSDRDTCDSIVQLLSCLSEEWGHEIANFLVVKEMASFFLRLLEDDTKGEVQAAAARILSGIPLTEKNVIAYLSQEGILAALVTVLKNGNSRAKENAAAALVKFSDPSDIERQYKVVEAGIFPVLIGTLSSGTTLAKFRAACALQNLSRSTPLLSIPSPMTGCLCFKRLPRPACKVHLGPCGQRSTFCLVEADAVSGLISLLDERESEAAGAGMDALSTLIYDEMLEKGVTFLDEMGAVSLVVNLVSHGTDKSKEIAVNFLGSIFKVKRMREKYGPQARIPLVELATHGNNVARKKAAKVLAQLEVIHEISSFL